MKFDPNDPAWRFDAPPGAGTARYARESGALVLEGNGTKACFGRWIGPQTPIVAGQPYAITVNGRLEGMPPNPRVHLHALVNWVDQDGDVLTRDYIDGYGAGGSEPLMSATLEAPKNAVGAYLEMAIKWPGKGRVIFTGAFMEAVERPPAKKVRLAAAFTAFPGNKQGNLDALLEAIDNAARERPDLLCLGETALRNGLTVEQAAVDMDGPEVMALRERAQRHGMIIVVGLTERDGPLFFNCALVIGSDGGVIGKYRKVNLPLAEIEEGYSPGFAYPVFDTPIGKIGVMICWDMNFTEPARILADKGAQILCAPSYWYSDLQTPARAADNGVFLVVSAPRDSKEPCRVIDPLGRVVAQCLGGEEYERGVCVAEVDVRQRHYIYWHSVGPHFGDHGSITRQERREDTYTFHSDEAVDLYDTCPTLETPSFLLRLVSEDDAEDLLACYADPKSQDIFDSENCTSDFRYQTVEEVADCIRFWLWEYSRRMYVRFAIVDKQIGKAIGTAEMFNAKGFLHDYDGGILRIDLASRYETTAYLSELLALASDRFYELFGTDIIVTKGRPAETSRVSALAAAGYEPFDWNNPERQHYFSRVR